MNILLTGMPGVGKTSIIKRVIGKLGDAGGFYTEEMREGERRVGFKIVMLSGREGVLAHVNCRSRYRVGKYGVNIDDLEKVGVGSIREAIEKNKIVVIDEIGRMELCSEKFRKSVKEALNKGKVFGTIMLKSEPFADEIKRRGDTKIIYVNRKNCDRVTEELLRVIPEDL
jgi:nucleoside-triphosphatase